MSERTIIYFSDAEKQVIRQGALVGQPHRDIAAKVSTTRPGTTRQSITVQIHEMRKAGALPKAVRSETTRPEPEDDSRFVPKRRRCLGRCGKMFMSKWIGNRMCPSCIHNGRRR